MPKQRTWTELQLREAVKNSRSIAECLFKLQLKPTGGNYKQFRSYIIEYNLSIDHFTGQGWNVGGTVRPAEDLSTILVVNRSFNGHHLKNRLIKENIFPRRCSKCKLSTWMGDPIPLELDHKNGDNRDQRLLNLRLLCPNCHAQTFTYRGKNKSRSSPIGEAVDLKSTTDNES